MPLLLSTPQLFAKFGNFKTRDSTDELVDAHLYLVEQIARRMHRRLPRTILLDDLRGDGMIGLLSAARHFDPFRGVTFATFASHRIRGAIVDGLRAVDPWPKHLRAKMRSGKVETDDVRNEPTAPRALPTFGPLQAVVQNEPTAEALRSRTPDPSHRIETRDLLASLLRQLPGSDRRTVYFKWIKELEQKEIAHRWNISQARVSVMHARAMRLLRHINA